MIGVDEFSIERYINDIKAIKPGYVESNSKKGGYHNSQIFFTDELIKAMKMVATKKQINMGNHKVETESSSHIDVGTQTPVQKGIEEAVKKDIAITTIIETGNVEALKCLFGHYLNETKAVAEVKRLQEQHEDDVKQLELASKLDAYKSSVIEYQDIQLNRRKYIPGQLCSNYD